jgi:hypothetical protein
VSDSIPTVAIDDSSIDWIETVSGGKVRVRNAHLVRLDYGGSDGELGYQVTPSNGGTCFVPLRAIARIDVKE